METDKILEKIVIERNKKGFSYENMADELGVTVSGYRKIETGNTKLTVERLFKIASILDIPLTELLNLDKDVLYQHNHDNESVFQQKIEHFYQENKDKTEKIEQLYESLLKEKEKVIIALQKIIEKGE